jgi:type I restriction enzyme R subunit
MTDKHGHVIEDRVYAAADMNRKLVLEKRDEVVAARITDYLKATGRYDKTIVFCEDIDHASTYAPGALQRQRRYLQRQPQVRGADHG